MAGLKRFQRGSGCFKCGVCGRMTRHTGVQGTDSDCCPQCYDLAGWQNSVWDGCFEKKDIVYRDELIQDIAKKGGDVEAVKAEMRDLFAFQG